MGTTHIIDERDKGCGWLNGDTHGWKGVCTLLSAIHVWPPFSQLLSYICKPCFVFVVPIQLEEGYSWLNGHHTQHGWKIQGMWLVEWWHTHGWQRQGVRTHLSVMDGRYTGCGWLNGDTHMDDRGKGYVPISLSCTYATPIQPAAPFTLASMFLVCDPHSTRGGVRQDETMGTTGKWEHKHMDDKVKGTYRDLCHTRVRPSLSQMFPSLCHIYCVCCGRHSNQRRGMAGWMSSTHSMDDRGKGYVPISLPWTYAIPFSQPCPSLSSTPCMCETPIQPEGRVERAPHTTWMEETRGMVGEWGLKHMDDKGKGTYPSLCHTRVLPPISHLYPSVCHPCCVCVLHSTREEILLVEWAAQTQHGLKRKGIGLTNVINPWMTEGRLHTIISDMYVCDPHSASPSLCNPY